MGKQLIAKCVYVARYTCGCVLGISVLVEGHEQQTAEEVAGFIVCGLNVDRVDVKTYQDKIAREPTFLRCPHVEYHQGE